MNLKPRLGAVTLAVAAIIAAGTVVLRHAIQIGAVTPHGARLMALLIGAAICGTGAFLFRRAARRRADLEAMAAMLPRYRDHRHAWATGGAYAASADPFLFDEADAAEHSERMPIVRAEIRAATRALLVSLEEEMRRESGRERRPGRPACRRARLRAAGRAESRRRRTPGRPTTIPS